MRICIIEAELPSDDLVASHGTFGDMFSRWLGEALPEAQFESVSIYSEERAPVAAGYDGFLISGSPHGVYEDLPWMRLIKALLADARESEVPVAGVCFGHQIMAEAFGGRVEKSDRGWALGHTDYELTEAGDRVFGADGLSVIAFHQDQVVEAPPGSTVLLGNAHCPIAALEYDHPAMSVQFHPEFTEDFARTLLDRFSGEVIPERLARAASEGLKPVPDTRKVAEAFASFYRRRAPGQHKHQAG